MEVKPMSRRQFLSSLRQAVIIFLLALSLVTYASAAEKILHVFHGRPAVSPVGGVVFDTAGNLYGMSSMAEGTRGVGAIFKLTPPHDFNVLYRFKGGNDGFLPVGDAVLDADGNIYGITMAGGSNSCDQGCGTVFRLSPNADRGWTETVLYRFKGGNDGESPLGGLVLDDSGNLYGTTFSGGEFLNGTVFELSPGGAGWTKTILHSFNGSDGDGPEAKLIRDSAGNLYGTTDAGGVQTCVFHGCGVVFKLTSHSNGWTESVLYEFQGDQDGMDPRSRLVLDAAGNLYGTTYDGGSLTCATDGCGVVYELKPNAGGAWTKSVLHTFHGKDGSYPTAGVIFDKAGNLYGATSSGGRHQVDVGTVFKLTPSGGKWVETVLQSFSGPKGCFLFFDLTIDTSNDLYSTTEFCGADKNGVVFEIIP
jgi:uncharacterized repeat protein (TIGR03803 family)